ncbi:hypothetical protein HY004_02520 [Candidatus Saccharibacteria bacterium]|nr:hypothetical protein [Candidatus Saccharibacteria bacterium]
MATKTAKPQALTEKTANISYQSNPFSLSFDKFGLFFEKNLGWAIALIVFPIFYFFLQMLGAALDTSTESAHAAMNTANTGVTPWLAAVVAFLVLFSTLIIAFMIVAGVALNTFITGLFTYVALENDAGRTARFGAALDAVVSRFWRLFLAQLLALAKIFGWTLLLIVPGIVAAFRYALLPYVIMDESAKEKGVKKSHERVKTLVQGRKREVFGVATVAAIIPFVGGINQLVGNAALYRQLQVFNDKKLEKAPVHWLNYFGFMLIGLYVLLIVFIVSIAVVAYISDPSQLR